MKDSNLPRNARRMTAKVSETRTKERDVNNFPFSQNTMM